MKTDTPKTILLKDYQVPDFTVDTIELYFDLHEDYARIRSKLKMKPNPLAKAQAQKVSLNGEELVLEQVSINGQSLSAAQYSLDTETLSFDTPSGNEFVVEIITKTEPQKNLAFDGLFKSSSNFLTQCEPEGFRRITYFPDRPDVMSKYTVTIEADEKKYPVLLSNGNRLESRLLGNGRHTAKWQDPFPKPSYLFALVAGDFGVLEDHYTTRSGRKVKLQIFTRKDHVDRCRWAMTSLQQAMKWDEDTFGLEYDLDIYMIVVTDDFNMGAMENKGLNIFNSVYVLAKPETATDNDFHGIQGVVGHEYFHNWTGNRVTCRDWFQLSLKEGLTVFRDQQFSADMTSKAVRRIEEISRLRTDQFAEDAGPMAHPIRPQSYIEINNFYTRTIYEKGAEVIRMIYTIVGEQGFRRGMDLYFQLFDGQAVRTEDFVHAMEKANDVDLTQFKNWYDQAGTPHVKASADYDQNSKKLKLTLSQKCAPTPGQATKKPFHIPVALGLLDKDGKDLQPTKVLHLKEPSQTFVFENVAEQPVLSLLRGFSAPVRLDYDCSSKDLTFQLAHDSDAYCRWEASQQMVIRFVQARVTERLGEKPGRESAADLGRDLSQAFGRVLKTEDLDPAFKALLLELPSEPYLSQFFPVVHPKLIHEAREELLSTLAKDHAQEFHAIFETLAARPSNVNTSRAAGERAMKNTCLLYLVQGDEKNSELALRAFRHAKNMTEELGAISALNKRDSTARTTALQEFYAKWKDETLVMNKWLNIQSVAPLANTLAKVRELAKDPVFDETNPNKVMSLYLRFGSQNPICFHDGTGDAYRFMSDRILAIDPRNPQLAARLASVFNPWKLYDSKLQAQMKTELERIVAQPGLSKNTFEIVSKALS